MSDDVQAAELERSMLELCDESEHVAEMIRRLCMHTQGLATDFVLRVDGHGVAATWPGQNQWTEIGVGAIADELREMVRKYVAGRLRSSIERLGRLNAEMLEVAAENPGIETKLEGGE